MSALTQKMLDLGLKEWVVKGKPFFGTIDSYLLAAHPSTTFKRCRYCRKMTSKWERCGGFTACYDGCFSTTGWDNRTLDGIPLWLQPVEVTSV